MYLRHSTIRKDGKAHTYWRLVRSVRRDGKVQQETVAQLGELDADGRLRAKALARKITGRSEQYELFEESLGPEQTVAVRLDLIRLERTRRFGDCWLAWTLWRALGLDRICAELMPAGREEVSWPTMAAVLVMSRLCEPSSELHIAEDFYRSTALENILDLPCEQVNDDRLYRALDRLLPHKEVIEQRLQKRLGELFELNYDLLLYDVTSTFFEGAAARNSQVLWKTLEQWQQRAGLGNSPRTLLDEFARLQSADIVIPLAEEPQREIRLRCVVRPDKRQAELLAHLGLRLPERLRRPTTSREM